MKFYLKPVSYVITAVIFAIASVSTYATCTYSITNQWNNGFTANIKITNSKSTPINNWSVTWRYASDNRVTNLWNANLTGTNPYTAGNLSWNASIPVGQSIEFGFQGTKGSANAEVPSITGDACTGSGGNSSSVQSSRSVSSVKSSVAPSSKPRSSVAPSSRSVQSSSRSSQSVTDELMPNSPWTYLGLSSGITAPYNTHTFAVPAAQNWVNSGLYLKKGQTVQISATGQWTPTGGNLHGPTGSGSQTERGCVVGTLTARIGLYYLDSQLGCIGNQGTYTAPKDGILFLGSIVSTDLGETYETRKAARGELQVTVTSQGSVVPTIRAEDTANYNYPAVVSGWVEVLGKHTILTIPASLARQDANILRASVARLDAMYASHLELRGKAPYHAQPIRWFADQEAPGYMLAGNPVRTKDSFLDPNNANRITAASVAGTDYWGYVHELGHNFNFAGGEWYYVTFGGLEVWPNIFSVYTQEKLNLPVNQLECPRRKREYLASGSTDVSADPFTGLCFLLEFKEKYGWAIYKNFYQKFNTQPGYGWTFLRTRFAEAAGTTNVNSIFDEWKTPRD
jgi:Cellulose binding domain/Peptidase M60, enhancin and enhancin-like